MSKKRECDTTSNKVKKRFCFFNNLWLNDEKCKEWLKKIDENTANCTLCNKNFTIKYEGFFTVKKHFETNDHISNSKTRSKQNAINNFFIKRDSNEENKVISTEVAFIYHSIRHNHSYLSMECGMKISPKLFPDSKISKKVSCARTKS
jgi:hypothetical protein